MPCVTLTFLNNVIAQGTLQFKLCIGSRQGGLSESGMTHYSPIPNYFTAVLKAIFHHKDYLYYSYRWKTY